MGRKLVQAVQVTKLHWMCGEDCPGEMQIALKATIGKVERYDYVCSKCRRKGTSEKVWPAVLTAELDPVWRDDNEGNAAP